MDDKLYTAVTYISYKNTIIKAVLQVAKTVDMNC